jgi:hypothetical protein
MRGRAQYTIARADRGADELAQGSLMDKRIATAISPDLRMSLRWRQSLPDVHRHHSASVAAPHHSWSRGLAYSETILACLMTFAQRSTSVLIWLARAAGVEPTGSTPISASRDLSTGSSMASRKAL